MLNVKPKMTRETPKTDEELAEAYQKGDAAAFKLLIDRYIDPIFSYIFRLTKNRQDTEDISQDTFVRVWKGFSTYHSSSAFRPWIFSIAHNCAIDFFRKKRELVFSDFAEADSEQDLFSRELSDPLPLAEELIAKVEDKELVEKLVSELPAHLRSVVLLHSIEEMTFEEVAIALGRPRNTVKSQYRRALLSMEKGLIAAVHPK